MAKKTSMCQTLFQSGQGLHKIYPTFQSKLAIMFKFFLNIIDIETHLRHLCEVEQRYSDSLQVTSSKTFPHFLHIFAYFWVKCHFPILRNKAPTVTKLKSLKDHGKGLKTLFEALSESS